MKAISGILLVFACPSLMAQAQAPMSAEQLVKQSDFVGFIQADANLVGTAPGSEWRQEVFLSRTEPIKGTLARNFGHNQYPFLKADHAGFAGYPTRFGEPGEYLVFLKAPGAGKNASWITLATYSVQYYPDGLNGSLSLQPSSTFGLLSPGSGSTPFLQPALPKAIMERWLTNLASGQTPSPIEKSKIYAFFRNSLQSKATSLRMVTPTYEERLALAQRLAAAITPGMTRAEVDKIFPQSDGGAFGSNAWRYYFGSEVMIDVPYDTTGGAFRPENKVNGPLRVYRSMMHLD